MELKKWLLVVVCYDVCTASVFPYVSHYCMRSCVDGEPPMVCEYNFTLDWYLSMGQSCANCPFVEHDCYLQGCIAADGFQRPVMTANRKIPGPDIQVCLDDEIIVNVKNGFASESTTIHWHGLHQKNTQFMDGVPYLSQCPIQPGNTFRYNFFADIPGTHFWHSHSGLQRLEGLYGSLIIREPPSKNVHLNLYDFDLPEHIIIISDWIEELSLSNFLRHYHDGGENKPTSLLVNGRGRGKIFSSNNTLSYTTPLEAFAVQKGFRYRFRIISNGGLNCPVQISVDNHTMTVIASDGKPVKPVEVEAIILYAGERFDIVLAANQEKYAYWFRLKGHIDCHRHQVFQTAILRYDGVGDNIMPNGEVSYDSCERKGLVLNPLNAGPNQVSNAISIVELDSLEVNDETSQENPDVKIYLPYDYEWIKNPHYKESLKYPKDIVSGKPYTPQFNHISMMVPPVPLISQFEEIPKEMICDHRSIRRNCTEEFCECIYIIDLPLGIIVEIFLIDKGFQFDSNHPIHFHGHSFRVVAINRVGENVTLEEVLLEERQGIIKRKLNRAILKDTVTVPDGGYTIIRFTTDNPGFWLMHCHLDFHAELGMAVIFKVGNKKQMPELHLDFPKCGNWMPSLEKMANPDSMPSVARDLKASLIQISILLCLSKIIKCQ